MAKKKTYTKVFWKSKTFWVNTLGIAGGILTALSGELATGGAITIAGMLNIVLRIMTQKGITLTK